ncbi:hypothetical protein Peur_057689 [Populus x canadensis]
MLGQWPSQISIGEERRKEDENKEEAQPNGLSFLGVEQDLVIIPSVQELTDTWKGRCGFSPTDNNLSQKIISFNILMFPSTVRPQKALLSTPAGSPPEAMDADADADAEVDENSDSCEKLARLDLNLKIPESEDQEVGALKLLNQMAARPAP